MKIFITSILCIIQSVYTFTSINYNKPFKYNNILLNTATYANINKKKWNPPIGYIPESLKNKKKKWNPPIGYVPESLKNKKITYEIDYNISKVKNLDLLFSNITDEISYIAEKTDKLLEITTELSITCTHKKRTTTLLRLLTFNLILNLKNINRIINQYIETVSLEDNENNDHNYWHGNIP
tara:strand:- start:117 stop:659 length:543 start_codon:yes stop_codon:yes gene_type:complete